MRRELGGHAGSLGVFEQERSSFCRWNIMTCSELFTIRATPEPSSSVARAPRRFRSVAHLDIGVLLDKSGKSSYQTRSRATSVGSNTRRIKKRYGPMPEATDMTGGGARHVRERHCCKAWSCVANAATA